MTMGKKIQKLRKAKGWTQEDLASQICISRQALSKWEQDAVIPDTENVVQISKIFGVSTDYLLNDDYESDADIPAVTTSSANLTNRFRAKVRLIISAAISCVGLMGFAVLYFLAVYSPVYYATGEAGTDSVASGFGVFVAENRLECIVVLFAAAIIVGVVLALFFVFQNTRQNDKKEKNSQGKGV